MNTARDSFAKSIRVNSETVCTPGCENCDRLRTIVVRFESGLPIDSKVLRPMTMTWPVVIFLNHLKSSGKCHGILFCEPMTRLRDIAAIALKEVTGELGRGASTVPQDLPDQLRSGSNSGTLRRTPPIPIRYNEPAE